MSTKRILVAFTGIQFFVGMLFVKLKAMGVVYIMATKEDFKMRYRGKTHFTVKKVTVNAVQSLNIPSDYPHQFLVVLRQS